MKISRLFIVGLLAVTLFSCAKEAKVSNEEIQTEQLNAYMTLTYGNDPSAWPTRADMGYYYIPLATGPGMVMPVDDNWVKYDITAQYQDKTVYFSTFSQTAKAVNGFSTYIHYIPEYYPLGDKYNVIPRSIADAIKRMKVGDSLRLIMPPSLAGSLYVDVRENRSTRIIYNPNVSGQTAPPVDASQPIIFDIVLRAIVADPSLDEQDQVLAFRNANYSDLDSTKLNFFYKELSPPTDPTDTVVVKDGYTVSVKYTGKFLDNFMFDTSMADTATVHGIYIVSTGTTPKYVDFSFQVGGTGAIKGFSEAVKQMKVGARAVTFFTSDWAYGAAGDNKGIIPIPYYCPLQFEIKLVSVTPN